MAKKKAASKKAASEEKFKLSKEQKERVAQIVRLENRISVCREYIQYWLKFFQLFAHDIHDRQILPDEEKSFFQTVTTLARKHFLFCELMGDNFTDGQKVLDVLKVSVSLANIKGMDDSTLSKLELDWHTLLLEMNVTLGRLLRLMPPNMKFDERLLYAENVARGLAENGTAPDEPQKKRGLAGLFKR